jgi:hypothetical protein
MTLLIAADAAGLLDRAVEILAATDTPTRQMRAGERWLWNVWQEVAHGS